MDAIDRPTNYVADQAMNNQQRQINDITRQQTYAAGIDDAADQNSGDGWFGQTSLMNIYNDQAVVDSILSSEFSKGDSISYENYMDFLLTEAGMQATSNSGAGGEIRNSSPSFNGGGETRNSPPSFNGGGEEEQFVGPMIPPGAGPIIGGNDGTRTPVNVVASRDTFARDGESVGDYALDMGYYARAQPNGQTTNQVVPEVRQLADFLGFDEGSVENRAIMYSSMHKPGEKQIQMTNAVLDFFAENDNDRSALITPGTIAENAARYGYNEQNPSFRLAETSAWANYINGWYDMNDAERERLYNYYETGQY